MQPITTAEAAERLSVSPRRVVQLIESGRLKARRFAGVWAIEPRHLAAVADRKPGRPRKPAQTR